MLYQLSHFRLRSPPIGGAESQIRTGDTAIFSRVLYQLSYLGPMVNQPSAARRRVERYHGPCRTINDVPVAPLLQASQRGRVGGVQRRVTGQLAEAVDPVEDRRMGVHQP